MRHRSRLGKNPETGMHMEGAGWRKAISPNGNDKKL